MLYMGMFLDAACMGMVLHAACIGMVLDATCRVLAAGCYIWSCLHGRQLRFCPTLEALSSTVESTLDVAVATFKLPLITLLLHQILIWIHCT